jgi:pimeloyl-ACP methyl ester carboxylesterase
MSLSLDEFLITHISRWQAAQIGALELDIFSALWCKLSTDDLAVQAWNPEGMTVEVFKGFVEVGGAVVHYTRLGEGPAVVLLHASPCSAKVMKPLQDAWCDEFTTFAFDLPGFGLSDAIGTDEVDIPRIADCIAGAMETLGVAQYALYGRHTGASVCLDIACRHAERVAVLITDGLPILAAPLPADRLDGFLQAPEQHWDGAHLLRAFFRYREQHVFWPWEARDLAHRADTDLPGPDYLARGALEVLESAAGMGPVHRSVYLYDARGKIADVRVPAYFCCRPGDSLYRTRTLYPPEIGVQIMPREQAEAAKLELDLLRRHKAAGAVPEWKSRIAGLAAAPDMIDYLPTRHGLVQVRVAGAGRAGPPLLFLPQMPGSFVLHEADIAGLAAGRCVIAIDPGGNGESALSRQQPSLPLWCEQVEDVLAALSVDSVDIHACGIGAMLALGVADRLGARAGRIVLQSPPLLEPELRAELLASPGPDLSADEHGTFLLRLWHHLRDQQLWWPWTRSGRSAVRRHEPDISPAVLTAQSIVMLKQRDAYLPIWREALSADLKAMLQQARQPVEIRSRERDLFGPAAAAFCGEHPDIVRAVGRGMR